MPRIDTISVEGVHKTWLRKFHAGSKAVTVVSIVDTKIERLGQRQERAKAETDARKAAIREFQRKHGLIDWSSSSPTWLVEHRGNEVHTTLYVPAPKE